MGGSRGGCQLLGAVSGGIVWRTTGGGLSPRNRGTAGLFSGDVALRVFTEAPAFVTWLSASSQSPRLLESPHRPISRTAHGIQVDGLAGCLPHPLGSPFAGRIWER